MTCEHENFVAKVDVNRLTRSDDDPTVIAYTASVWIHCLDCEEPFRFLGDLPVGDVASEPATSVDRTELRLPCAPVSAPNDWGLERASFTVTATFDPGRSN